MQVKHRHRCVQEQLAPLKEAGIKQIFTPGAPTKEIVDWVSTNLETD